MHKKINIIIYTILFILIIGFIIISIFNNQNKKVLKYTTKFNHLDVPIYIELTNIKKEKATELFNEIEQIYIKYEKLIDKNNNNNNNLYYIINNDNSNEYITINSDLYELINYGYKWYKKSKGLLDISKGNIVDEWKKIKENKKLPNKEELNNQDKFSIKDIELKENNQIKNNHVNIDLTNIIVGYVTEETGQYLENKNINNYLINADGRVKAGKKYDGLTYKIGLEDPFEENKTYKIVQGNNISLSTRGIYDAYTYDNKIYSNIINPNNLYPEDFNKSVTVITKSCSDADALATILNLMDKDKGKEFLKKFKAEATWYVDTDKEYYSDNFDIYEH